MFAVADCFVDVVLIHARRLRMSRVSEDSETGRLRWESFDRRRSDVDLRFPSMIQMILNLHF